MRRRFHEKARFFLICLLLTAAILAVICIDRSLQPIIRAVAVANVENAVGRKINEAVEHAISGGTVETDSIISFEKDADGKINAVKTNIMTANRLKSSIALAILEEVTSITEKEIAVPVGSLTESNFLSGRGPRIPVRIIPVGSVRTELESRFETGGINQTIHRIFLEITVKMKILLPQETVITDVSESVVVAETVIVGSVPDYFADIAIPLGTK